MQNKTKLFKTAICIITTLILIFGTIPCGAVLSDESNTPTFTNLVVFMKFSDEDEFINNTYADTTVRNILDNTYNKSVYNVADYFKTVSGGKMNMQTLYLFDNNNSLTLSKPRGYYAEKDDQNPYGYESGEENSRMYELQADWANTISNAITNGNKPKDIEENQYNFADLDRNRDGKIDLITVIYKNTMQNISVGWNSPLWDYHSYSNMISVQEGVNTYQSGEYLQLTCNYENVNGLVLYLGEDNLPILPTGKICHETMHALGLKDLYRSNQTSAVYYMSLMAKHLTPIGQYISVKERESLGWLDNNQIKTIDKNGTYTLYPASAQNEVVAYKRDLSNGKTLYLEYRQFDDNGNKYDTKNKKLYSCNTGDLIKGVTLKSGLICYLANTGVRFPSNINTTGANWNMQVISNGQYSTMSDCAVGDGEELYIGNDIFVYVTNMSADKLEFEISGIAETTPTPTLTPSPTPSPTPTPTINPTPTVSPSPIPSPTPTATPRPTHTTNQTATPTISPTTSSRATPHPTPTITPTATPTATPKPTSNPTATPTESPTLIPTSTPKPTPRPTAQPISSPTATTNPTITPATSPTATMCPTASPTHDINCNIEGNNISVKLTNSTSVGIILISEFNSDGRLLRCTTHSPQENISVSLLSETHTVKVMWWNSLNNLVPITDSKTVTR